MFELEDYSTGFHDGFLNKYTDSSGPTLDFYISDSLQDMLDIDIRAEVATVVGGSNELASLASDLPSSFDHVDSISNDYHNNGGNNSTSTSNGISYSSSWLGGTGPAWSSSHDFYADVGACVNPISVMPMISSSLLHKSPKTTFNANRSATSPPPASPTENKSHLTFSPHQIKISTIRQPEINSHIPKLQQLGGTTTISNHAGVSLPRLTTTGLVNRKSSAVESVKKDLVSEITKSSSTSNSSISSSDKNMLSANGILSGSNTIKLAPGIGGLTFANSVTYNKLKQQSAKSPNGIGSPITSNGTIVLKRDRDSSPLHNMATLNNGNSFLHHHHHHNQQQQLQQNNHNHHHHQVTTTKILPRNVIPKSIASSQSPLMQSGGGSSIGSPSSSSNGSNNGGFSPSIVTAMTPIAVKPAPKVKQVVVESEFPKPAYSYSCLIAIALKNSRSGSLPVSEIYSFMCEHFPYFKTARSGWKNSVRHNLSLNKCFEKIEKPATNGSQRKGFLWAMNPARIAKMDEEVQKWSRKDPMAIRNAMVFPEHLDALERGEMKHGSTGDSDVELDSQSEIEETSDSEQDQELDETIVEAHDMFIEEDIEEMSSVPQQHRDFDIEVEDIYDAIDIEDDKDNVHMAISPNDIIEVTTSSNSNDVVTATAEYQSPKRARLNINYSIGPAGELEKQIQQQNLKQQIKQQQQQQNTQTTTAATTGSSLQSQQVPQQQVQIHHSQNLMQQQQFQQITTIPHHNRRKMQLVNRIA